VIRKILAFLLPGLAASGGQAATDSIMLPPPEFNAAPCQIAPSSDRRPPSLQWVSSPLPDTGSRAR